MIDAANIHFQRALDFLKDARTAQSPDDKSRFLASSIENAITSQVIDTTSIPGNGDHSLPLHPTLKRYICRGQSH